MAPELGDLPRYLVLNPSSTVRIELRLRAPSCEIDLDLERPRPGRSFIVLLGAPGGPFVQRVRLAGRARLFFDPESPGRYEILLANPDREPLTLRLRGRDVGPLSVAGSPSGRRPTARAVGARSGRSRRRRPGPRADRRSAPNRRVTARPAAGGTPAKD